MLAFLALAGLFLGEDGRSLLTIDHYVKVRSTVPAMAGQTAQIYVRERVEAGTALRAVNLDDRVVERTGKTRERLLDIRMRLDHAHFPRAAVAGRKRKNIREPGERARHILQPEKET